MLWFYLGAICLSNNLPVQAEIYFDLSLSLDQKWAKSWFGLGVTQFRLKNFEKSFESFSQGLILQPDSEMWVLVKQFAQLSGKWDEYRKVLEKVFNIHPEIESVCAYYASFCYDQQKDYKRTEEICLKAVQKFPKNEYFLFGLGQAQNKLKKFEDAEKTLKSCLSRNPKKMDYYYELARVYEDSSKEAEAIMCLENCAKLDPSNVKPILLTANIYTKLKKLPEAITFLNNAINIEPKFSISWFYLGSLKKQQGDLEGSEKAYLEGLRLDPNNPLALCELGELYVEQKKAEQAKKYFRKSIINQCPLPDPWYNLGIILKSDKKFQQAEVAFRIAMNLDPVKRKGYSELVEILKNQGRVEELAKIIDEQEKSKKVTQISSGVMLISDENHLREEILKDPHNIPAWKFLTKRLRQEERFEDAIKVLTDAIKENPKESELYFELADLNLDLGKVEEGLNLYQKGVGLGTKNPYAWAQIGMIASLLGKESIAIEGYKNSLSLGLPEMNLLAWVMLGQLYMKQNRVNDAEKMFRNAINEDESYVRAWTCLIGILQAQKRYDEALSSIKIAMKHEPENPRLWILLGGTYMFQMKFDSAEPAFQKAIKIDPQQEDAWVSLVLLFSIQDPYRAEDTLQQGVRSCPSSPRLWQMLAQLYLRQGRLREASEAEMKAERAATESQQSRLSPEKMPDFFIRNRNRVVKPGDLPY